MPRQLHDLNREDAIAAARERLLEDIGQGDRLALEYAYHCLDGNEDFDPDDPGFRDDFEDFVHLVRGRKGR